MTFSWPRRSGNGSTRVHPTGANAEKMAEAHLTKQGLRVLERNYRCKQGEIDLIMEDQTTLIFVEVRFRKSALYGSAAETVTAAKQRKLVMAAQHYLLRNKNAQTKRMRFDVIGIMPSASGPLHGYEYTWIRDAFGAG